MEQEYSSSILYIHAKARIIIIWLAYDEHASAARKKLAIASSVLLYYLQYVHN